MPKKQQRSRADRLAEVQSDVYEVAERLEEFAGELSEAKERLQKPCAVGHSDAPIGAPVPVDNGPGTDDVANAWDLLRGVGEMVREQEVTLDRARRALGDLTGEIESWRMNIEEHFASTDRYARLEECEGQLNERLEAISYLSWFEAPEANRVDQATNMELCAMLDELREQVEDLRDTLQRASEDAGEIEFPRAFD
jgi:hypothetical protein